MSARPALALLPPEELDLLISRSVDGDLPADEREELEAYLASDPDARRRRDAMAALVRSVRELPVPEPPFALATRVNAQVAENASGIGSAWNRLGIYPPPGLIPAVILLVIAAAIGSLFVGGRAPRKSAVEPAPASERDAPVRVFFQESALRFEVELVGASSGWRLVSAPAMRAEGAIDATYHLTLDAKGRVASLRPLSSGANVRPDVAGLLRGLLFERSAGTEGPREVDVRISAR